MVVMRDKAEMRVGGNPFIATLTLSLRVRTSSGQKHRDQSSRRPRPDRRLSANFQSPVIKTDAAITFKKSPGK